MSFSIRIITAFAVLALCGPRSTRADDHSPANGLSATLQANPATVPMGTAIDFNVSLAFDTTQADPKTRILNRYCERCEFTFVNDRGESFHRQAFSEGMPPMMQPGNLIRLTHGANLVLDPLTVHLLSDEGVQLQPGKYLVKVTYVNDAQSKKEAYLDSAGQYRQRDYEGPWQIWSGRVDSAALTLTVLPASPTLVDVVIPTALATDTTTIKNIPAPDGKVVSRPMQLAWSCDPDSTRIVHVMKRPGFVVGNRWHLESRVAGKAISEDERGWSDAILGPGAKSFLRPDVTSQLLSANDSELILHMEVFETSMPPQHLWMPERGDFKVLWTGEVRHRLRGSKH